MAQAAIPHMKPGSAIINTGSITGIDGSKDLLDYSMTKGGIHAFTRALSGNLLQRGIRVNCRCAGTGLDAAQPVRQGSAGRFAVRREDADEATGPARGDRAGLCVPGLAALLELHHRRSPADHRRLLMPRKMGARAPRPDASILCWWAMTDSNRRHLRCKRSALPTELIALNQARTFRHFGFRPQVEIGNSAGSFATTYAPARGSCRITVTRCLTPPAEPLIHPPTTQHASHVRVMRGCSSVG